MNSLFNPPSNPSSNSLNPTQLMQAAQNFQGTPEQAKQQFIQTIVDSGMTKDQLNSLLDEIEKQGKMLGLFNR